MSTEKKDEFPNTVFITDLPVEYALSELSKLLESFGPIMEIEQMSDGHIRIRFENCDDARKCFVQAKKKKLEFKNKKIGVIPKNVKKQSQ